MAARRKYQTIEQFRDAKRKAGLIKDAQCEPGNPKNQAWLSRWAAEFKQLWERRGNKYYPTPAHPSYRQGDA